MHRHAPNDSFVVVVNIKIQSIGTIGRTIFLPHPPRELIWSLISTMMVGFQSDVPGISLYFSLKPENVVDASVLNTTNIESSVLVKVGVFRPHVLPRSSCRDC